MLTSRQNPLVKAFRKLHQGKYRQLQNQCLLEGTHLIEAALNAHWPIPVCCFTPDWQHKHLALASQLESAAEQTELVSLEVLAAMTTTQHPDGVVALVPDAVSSSGSLEMRSLGLILETIQDPGNLGTILRSAVAASVDGILLSQDCVALSNPKVLRASVGAWFRSHTQVVERLSEQIQYYQQQGFQVVATTPAASLDYWSIDWCQPSLILIGNEGAGVSQGLISLADQQVQIPIASDSESLNAAIAASLILFEVMRQRRGQKIVYPERIFEKY